MSKSSKDKQKFANVAVTNPALSIPTIYFSTLVKSQQQYNQITNHKTPTLIKIANLLKQEQVIPKYFDILAYTAPMDVECLNTPFYFKNDAQQLIMLEHNDDLNKEEDDTIILTHAQYHELALNNQSSMLEQLTVLKQQNSLPDNIPSFNVPYVKDNKMHFPQTNGVDEKFRLVKNFDTEFPRLCVFGLSFLLFGNQKPIEKFQEKLDDGIELSSNFEHDFKTTLLLNQMNTEIYELSNLGNAAHFTFDLDKQNFEKKLHQSLLLSEGSIVYYDEYPLFIGSKENNKQIRIPLIANSNLNLQFLFFGFGRSLVDTWAE